MDEFEGFVAATDADEEEIPIEPLEEAPPATFMYDEDDDRPVYAQTFAQLQQVSEEKEESPQLRQLAMYLNKEMYPMFSKAPPDTLEKARQNPRHKIWHMPTYIVAVILVDAEEPEKKIPKKLKDFEHPEWTLFAPDVLRYVRYLKESE